MFALHHSCAHQNIKLKNEWMENSVGGRPRTKALFTPNKASEIFVDLIKLGYSVSILVRYRQEVSITSLTNNLVIIKVGVLHS
jgi:hypothetical protein